MVQSSLTMTGQAQAIQYPDSTLARSSPLQGPLYAAILAAYVLVAGVLTAVSYTTLNPDGIAYIQIARHYAAGRLDLAVNSYWGPLLSWLLAPLIRLHCDPVLSIKLLSVAAGAVMAAGAAATLSALGGPVSFRARMLVFGLALLLALRMLPTPLTPDMLLAAIMSWYFALSLRLIRGNSRRLALAAGLLGGLAYLAKAYSLVYVPVQLVLLCLARRTDGSPARRPAVTMFACAMAGLLVVALPWIAVISIHDGAPTFGSSGALTAKFARWMRAGDDFMPMQHIQPLREGRLFAWENPVELSPESFARAQAWPDGVDRWTNVLADNAAKAFSSLAHGDVLCVMLAGLAVACALALRPAPTPPARSLRAARLLAAGSALVYLGGYVPVLVEERYLWPIWPLLAALAVHTGAGLVGRARWPAVLLTLWALTSIAGSTAINTVRWCTDERHLYSDWLLSIADVSGGPPRACNKWYEGLYVSYWTDTPFLGKIAQRDPRAIAEELAPYGTAEVMVLSDAPLAAALASHPAFERLHESLPANVDVFTYRPAAARQASAPPRRHKGP